MRAQVSRESSCPGLDKTPHTYTRIRSLGCSPATLVPGNARPPASAAAGMVGGCVLYPRWVRLLWPVLCPLRHLSLSFFPWSPFFFTWMNSLGHLHVRRFGVSASVFLPFFSRFHTQLKKALFCSRYAQVYTHIRTYIRCLDATRASWNLLPSCLELSKPSAGAWWDTKPCVGRAR